MRRWRRSINDQVVCYFAPNSLTMSMRVRMVRFPSVGSTHSACRISLTRCVQIWRWLPVVRCLCCGRIRPFALRRRLAAHGTCGGVAVPSRRLASRFICRRSAQLHLHVEVMVGSKLLCNGRVSLGGELLAALIPEAEVPLGSLCAAAGLCLAHAALTLRRLNGTLHVKL